MLSSIQQYFDQCYLDAEDEDQRYDVEKARAMVVGYCLQYQNDRYKTISVELPFELPLVDSVEGNPTGTLYNGIVDAVLEKDGQIFLCDHKTASPRTVNYTYWEALKGDPQITTYILAARQMGIPIKGFLWDVALKPTIRPKTLTKKAKKELEEHGTYESVPYPYDDWKNADVETPKLYGIRVLTKYTENPAEYFMRRDLYRDFDEVLDYMDDLQVVSDAMSRTDTEKKAIKNRTYCKAYNSLCEYHGMCFGDRSGYRDRTPRDTPFSSGSLSVSSINCFMNCRRKWYYQKVAKIEKDRDEYRDALAIGTMFHKGIEMFLEHRPSDIKLEYEGNLCNKKMAEEDTKNGS